MKAKIIALVLALVSVSTYGIMQLQANAYVDTGRDCDKYAVIRCGVNNRTELRTEYDSLNTDKSNGSTVRQSDIKTVFSALGISRADLNGSFVGGVVYQNGNVTVDGKVVAKNAVMGARSLGGTPIKNSSAAIVSVSKMGSAQRALVKLDSQGRFLYAVMTPCGNPVKAKNVVVVPKYSCEATVASKITRTEYRFKTTVNASNGATVKDYKYDFGDGKTDTSTSNSLKHNYPNLENDKSYKITVTPRFNVDGKVVTKNSCTATITVKGQPKTPEYSCDATVASMITRTEYSFKTTVNATNGATIKDYQYDFGDGETATSTDSTIKHNYPNLEQDKSYTITVTPRFNVDGKVVTKNTCTAKITVKARETHPAIDITKVVNDKKSDVVEVGKDFTYTLTVKNTGDVTAKDVVVTDDAPTGVTFKSADKGTLDGDKWTYTVASLAAGDSFTVKITAVINEYVAGTITNKACVDTTTIPGSPDDCDTADVKSPRVDITKYVNGKKTDEVNVGAPFEYQLVVRNTGSVDLKDVVVSDEAPAGITFQSADKGTIANNVWTYDVSSLAVGDSFTVKISAITAEAFTEAKVNTACVDSSTISGNPDDCDTAEITTKIKVCDTETDTIVWISKSDADNDRYTTDLGQCEKVEVCDASTGEIISVAKNDESNYESVDSDKCKVEVCDTSTDVVIKVDKADVDNEGYTTDLSQCEKVEVCDAATGEIISVAKNDESNYDSVDSDNCKDVVEVEVCDTSTNTIVKVEESEANNEGYTNDLSQCEKIEVCNPDSGAIISVFKSEASDYEDVDSASCKTKPNTPATELPETGLADTLGSILGVGSLTAATYYYVTSRRN